MEIGPARDPPLLLSPTVSPLKRQRLFRALSARPLHGAEMSSLDMFLPLAKVDLDRRLVTGIATAETPDRAGEICDYGSSKPYFEKWSSETVAASGGKSMGAVRAMHGKVAAGKLTDIAFDDDAKRVVVSAKIVDDDEWLKVQEGVYTGFSQGGRYVKRWPDPETGLIRYTAEPQEISLVDLPCLPEATFEVVKDGVVQKRAFASAERKRDARSGAAMPDGSYPIKSAKDVENAVKDYYRSGEKPDVKAHIVARAKAIGAESALPDDWTNESEKSALPAVAPNGAMDGPEALAKAAAAHDVRRRLARARRAREAGRRARSPAAAGEGCAARGLEDCGRRAERPRRGRGGAMARRAAGGSARACADQAQPGQPPAALDSRPSPTERRRSPGAAASGGAAADPSKAGHRLAHGGDRPAARGWRPPREKLSTKDA